MFGRRVKGVSGKERRDLGDSKGKERGGARGLGNNEKEEGSGGAT